MKVAWLLLMAWMGIAHADAKQDVEALVRKNIKAVVANSYDDFAATLTKTAAIPMSLGAVLVQEAGAWRWVSLDFAPPSPPHAGE